MHDARRTLMCSQSRSFWGRIVSLLLRYGVVAAQLKHVAGEAATDAREVPPGVWQDPQVARLISGLVFVKLGASGETTIGNLTSLKHKG